MRKGLFLASVAALVVLGGGSAVAQGRLIAVDSTRALYEIDMLTGVKTPIGTVSPNASTSAGLAYDRTNQIMYLTSTGNDSLYTLDIATGTATLVGFYGDASVFMHGLEYDDSTGNLYGVSSHNNGLYLIDKNTGVASLIGTSGLTSFTNLGYNSDTNVMYASNSGADSFYIMDRATGAVTLLGPLNGPTNPNGLAYNWSNQTMYLIDNSTDNLYTVDLATGAATLIGSTGPGNLLGLAYVNNAPATVSGRVFLQDWLGPVLGRQVRIEIYAAGGIVPLEGQTTALNHVGEYVVNTSLPPGQYDVYARASHWLRRQRANVTFTAAGASGVSFSLINGDCDSDNEVGIGDFAVLSAAFGSVPGDPNWDPEADLNGDDEVDIADYAILSNNFNQIGD